MHQVASNDTTFFSGLPRILSINTHHCCLGGYHLQ
jgi:hypothetical protein